MGACTSKDSTIVGKAAREERSMWPFKKGTKVAPFRPETMEVMLPPDKAPGSIVFDMDKAIAGEMYQYRFPKGGKAGEMATVRVLWQCESENGATLPKDDEDDDDDEEEGDAGVWVGASRSGSTATANAKGREGSKKGSVSGNVSRRGSDGLGSRVGSDYGGSFNSRSGMTRA
eukprot:CAMPEP_0169455210 /NCGR_PEP_ID=MMETSP1042-20121227/15697_1 /TAXON_ID=464988 /ORGANISM="Hemiselmis andersenii, Strain CCMP1180" /LENGTH=172 /DNA_ID=CAMNT_0009567349 /DNA_START=187 /DNA_END=702 /DNA_ORIENTATION=+